MNFSFLLNMNYSFVQNSCLRNDFFLSFTETYASFKHLKIGDFKDPFKQDATLAFCRNQIKDFSILIHYIRNNWLSFIPSFSPLDIVIQKNCLFCFIWVLKVSLSLTQIQNGCVSFNVSSSNGQG